MSEDASLDSFDRSEQGEAVDRSGDTGPETDADPDSLLSTYEWSPDGSECADCGETVERRWRDDGELVCVDCKEW